MQKKTKVILNLIGLGVVIIGVIVVMVILNRSGMM